MRSSTFKGRQFFLVNVKVGQKFVLHAAYG